MALKISVCLVVHNEEKRIEACLKALLAQPLSLMEEIVVIDNASQDRTQEVCRRLQAISTVPVRILTRAVNNLGAARANGMEASKSQYVAFIDADILVPPNWAERLVDQIDTHFLDSASVVAIGSSNHVRGSGIWGEAASLLFGAIDMGSPQIASAQEPKEVSHLSTCNVVFKRDAVLRAGNFSSEFARVCEDVEICCRLREGGGKLLFVPGFEVEHAQKSDALTWIERGYRYGWGNMKVTAKWPGFFCKRHSVALLFGVAPFLLATVSIELLVMCVLLALVLAVLISGVTAIRKSRKHLVFTLTYLMILIPASYAFGHTVGFFRYHVIGRGLRVRWT